MYTHITYLYLSLFLFLSLSLPICLSIYLSIHPSIYLSIVIFKMQPFHKTTMNSLIGGFPEGLPQKMAQADDGKVSSQNVTRFHDVAIHLIT